MKIAIPIFPGLTALDAVGPYEVLSRLPDAEVQFTPPRPARYAPTQECSPYSQTPASRSSANRT